MASFLRRQLRRFNAAREGGVAVMFALLVPGIGLLACGAVDLAAVAAVRTAFRDTADAVALDAALQIGISDPVGIASRAEQFARTELAESAANVTYTVTTDVLDNSSVKVTIAGNRPSFFVNLLPPGGWNIGAEATASVSSRTPLCVLSTGEDKLSSIKMDGSSRLSAPGCMVHSNEDIELKHSAVMQAAMVQSAGFASGQIYPSAQIGAPAIADPFGKIAMSISEECEPVDKSPKPPKGTPKETVVLPPGPMSLPPGLHCGNIKVAKGSTLHLEPGDHYFINGKLELQENAVLDGDDVVLIFDKKSDFKFKDQAEIRLRGRREGAFAGFVIATTRENDRTFDISTSAARELLGTIYIPNAKLLIDGGASKVADESAWTVIVAKALEMHGSPNLVVNANYAGSPTPVPAGVGPSSSVRLSQ